MTLSIGDKIPDFKGVIDENKTISLSNFRGKKLVIYFYPKDNTPGCTAESCNLRDNYSEFKSKNYEIVGISKDPIKSHKKFAEKYNLPFPLISDEDLSIHKIFGTWIKKKLYGREYMGTARMTFIINEEGILEKIIEKVKTKDHSDQIFE